MSPRKRKENSHQKRVDEDYRASELESALRKDFGVESGERTSHDGKTHLDVDYTYDFATPRPLALELTSAEIGPYSAASTAMMKVLGHLHTAAVNEDLGRWVIGISSPPDGRALEKEVLALMQAGTEVHPLQTKEEDVKNSDPSIAEAAALALRLGAMGLLDMTRWPGASGVNPLFAAGEIINLPGIEPLLERCVADNAAKLGKARADMRTRETHLAVEVPWLGGVARDAQVTLVPQLPPEIDVIWVVDRTKSGRDNPYIWRAARGDSEWTTHANPARWFTKSD